MQNVRDIVTLAEILATQDGKLAAFRAERDGVNHSDYSGWYDRYFQEATDILARRKNGGA
jgi:hypothetical protein